MGYSILRGRLFTVAVILAATGCRALAQEGAKAGNPAGWLGVMLGPPRVENREESAGIPPGVVVTGVVESGPADRAGIRSKDRIVSVDGSAVASAEELIATVKRLAPDTWVSLSIDRRGKPIELRARLGLRPSTLSDLRPVRGWIGAEAIDLTPSLRTLRRPGGCRCDGFRRRGGKLGGGRRAQDRRRRLLDHDCLYRKIFMAAGIYAARLFVMHYLA